MNNRIITVIFFLIAALILFFVREMYGGYNLNRTIDACVLAQKQTSQDFNQETARKFCEKEIKKKTNK